MCAEPARAPSELLRALAVFAEPPGPEHPSVAHALGFDEVPRADDWAELFLFQLYPYASVYLGADGWMGGEARERIAGFWRAVGRTPPPEPDHLTALMGLYVALTEESSARDGAGAALTDEAARTLLHEHLAPWLPAYLDRAAEIGPGCYRGWASLLGEVIQAELLRLGSPTGLPAHLREAPPLADPRAAGGTAFLDGLLAPVRAGALVTRTDLALLARELGLGLRAGERRYALEALVSQEPVETLRRLADFFDQAAEAHVRRRGPRGPSADFFASRARGTAALLGELAREGDEAIRGAQAPTALT